MQQQIQGLHHHLHYVCHTQNLHEHLHIQLLLVQRDDSLQAVVECILCGLLQSCLRGIDRQYREEIDVEKLNDEIYHYDEGKYCLDEEIHGDDEKVTDGDYFEDKGAGEYQDAKVCDFEERQLDGDLDRRTGEGQYFQSYYVGLDDRRRADGNQDRDIELCGGDNCGERKVDEGQYLQFYDGDIDYKGTDEDQNDNEESSGYSDYSADHCVKSKLHIYEDDSDDFEDFGA